MKKLLFILLFILSTFGFSQNNHLLKTEDGRRVLLKADFTWEYVDLQKPEPVNQVKEKPNKINSCNVSADFKEPKLNSKVQNQLRKGRATISHIKKKIAKEFNCTTDEVILLSASEKKENGLYDFCANGTKVSYKRVGNSILKAKNSITF